MDFALIDPVIALLQGIITVAAVGFIALLVATIGGRIIGNMAWPSDDF